MESVLWRGEKLLAVLFKPRSSFDTTKPSTSTRDSMIDMHSRQIDNLKDAIVLVRVGCSLSWILSSFYGCATSLWFTGKLDAGRLVTVAGRERLFEWRRRERKISRVSQDENRKRKYDVNVMSHRM